MSAIAPHLRSSCLQSQISILINNELEYRIGTLVVTGAQTCSATPVLVVGEAANVRGDVEKLEKQQVLTLDIDYGHG